jgi:hypothetical protein
VASTAIRRVTAVTVAQREMLTGRGRHQAARSPAANVAVHEASSGLTAKPAPAAATNTQA